MTEHLQALVRRHMVDARLDIPLEPGHITVLFGPSGSGKTTILRCIAGLERTEGGRIECAGELWDDGRRHFTRPRERRVGLLFQDHALFPHMSVAANVAYGLPRQSRAARVERSLHAVHAGQLIERRRVAELSGGEAQRVALARALAPRPRILLLDEPLSALDAPTRRELRADLRQILRAEGIPSIVVTHDRAEALALGDTGVVLIDGQVRQTGAIAEVFDRPRDADVARVVGIETALPGRVVSCEGGIARVAMGPHEITAVTEEDLRAGDDVYVCVRSEDVSLETAPSAGNSSPRNHIPAVVTDVTEEGPLVRVDLHAGVRLTSTITRPSAAELGIVPGLHVVAVVKSTAVHLIPHQPLDEASQGAATPSRTRRSASPSAGGTA